MKKNWMAFLERYGLVAVTAAIIAFFFIHPATSDTFGTLANWRSIFGSMSIQILLAAAFTLPLITGKIDISSGAIAVMCSVIFAGLIGSVDVPITGAVGLNWIVAAAIVTVVGAALGAVNGMLVRAGADALIATLSSAIILSGLVSGYAQGRAIVAGMPPQLLDLGRSALGPFPTLFIVAVVIALAVWFLLERTSFGRRLHAVGVNPTAARLIGVKVPQTIFTAFVIGGLIAGLAAVLTTARQGGGVPNNGLNLILPALAGTYLGATTIRPGEFNIPGTFVGLLFVSVTVSGLTLFGIAAWVQPVFSGCALVAAVLIAHWFQKLAAAGS
jgi:ribose/xylose/arabinose/galactoside ABC-type transport system permease subunit